MSDFLNFMGNTFGGLWSTMAANASSYRQYKYQKQLQSHAAQLNYDYSKKYAQNAPSFQRQGLESAGYNPMLAVQNSTSGANASFTSAGNAVAPDNVGAISSGIANAQSFQRLKNETKQAESQVKMNDATAENQNSQAINNLEENKWISPKRKAEIANIEGDTLEKEARIENMKKQIELGFAGISVQQDANAIRSELNRILEKTSPSGRSQSFSNYAGGIRNIMSGFGDIIHGRNDYEDYYEEQQLTKGKKGLIQEKTTSRRSGRRKKR